MPVLTERELITGYIWNKLVIYQRQYRSRYQQFIASLLYSSSQNCLALLVEDFTTKDYPNVLWAYHNAHLPEQRLVGCPNNLTQLV